MDKRQELINLSGQIINGFLSADNSLIETLFDRSSHSGIAQVSVEIAYKMLEKVDELTKNE